MSEPARKHRAWNPKNDNDYWCIKMPNGTRLSCTVGYFRTDAIFNFLLERDSIGKWKKYYKQGFRAVKIRIVEME